MLGHLRRLSDARATHRRSRGVEGAAGEVAGLGLLDVETVLTGDKTLRECEGRLVADAIAFRGYEMHVGRTSGPDAARPLLRFADGRLEGAISGAASPRQICPWLFGHDGQRAAWLKWLGAPASALAYAPEIERVLDCLAAHLEAHAELDGLFGLAR